jgi:LemA protein
MRNKKFLIGGIILLMLIIFFVISFNSLVKKDEDLKLAWNEMQNAYQRRLDLVPNLVRVVKGASDYERKTLLEVTEARSSAAGVATSEISANDYQKQEQAHARLANSMNRMIAVIENYPDLKSTKSYVDLQAQLEGTERRIKVARKDFNASVADYNKITRRFPRSLAAKLFGFAPKAGFEADTETENSPEVKF